jgi:hypothetical protein
VDFPYTLMIQALLFCLEANDFSESITALHNTGLPVHHLSIQLPEQIKFTYPVQLIIKQTTQQSYFTVQFAMHNQIT